MLPAWPGEGQVDFIPRDEPGLRSGLKIAVTEWNWRGWGKMDPRQSFDPALAAALGVARTLQGMIRAGDRVSFATQSMLVGAGWRFAAVYFNKDVPGSAHFSAQGQTTDFYRHTMGTELLRSELTLGLETLRIHVPGSKETVPAGAVVDALASRDRDDIRIHVINRHRDNPLVLTIHLDGFGNTAAGRAQGLVATTTPSGVSDDLLQHIDSPVSIRDGQYVATLPEAGIYTVEIPLERGAAKAAGSN
jgi:hypothetical protein